MFAVEPEMPVMPDLSAIPSVVVVQLGRWFAVQAVCRAAQCAAAPGQITVQRDMVASAVAVANQAPRVLIY